MVEEYDRNMTKLTVDGTWLCFNQSVVVYSEMEALSLSLSFTNLGRAAWLVQQ